MNKAYFRIIPLTVLSTSFLVSCDDSNSIFNFQDLINVLFMTGTFSILTFIVGAFGYRTPSYRAKKKVEETEANAQKELGNKLWNSFIERFNASLDDKETDNYVQDFIEMNHIGIQGIQALLDYAEAKKHQQAVENGNYTEKAQGDSKHNEDQFYRFYYQKGYNLQTDEEKHDAQLRYESTRNAALAFEPDADIYTDIGLYKLLHEGISETQEKVMQEYIAARAVHDGVIFRNKVDRIKNSESSPN